MQINFWASCRFLNIFSKVFSRFDSCTRALELDYKHMSSHIDVLLMDLSTTSLRTTPPPLVSICGLCHNCANYNHHIGMYMCIPCTSHLFVTLFFQQVAHGFFDPCFRHCLTLMGSALFYHFCHHICLLLARLEYYLRVHLFFHVIHFLDHINT